MEVLFVYNACLCVQEAVMHPQPLRVMHPSAIEVCLMNLQGSEVLFTCIIGQFDLQIRQDKSHRQRTLHFVIWLTGRHHVDALLRKSCRQ